MTAVDAVPPFTRQTPAASSSRLMYAAGVLALLVCQSALSIGDSNHSFTPPTTETFANACTLENLQAIADTAGVAVTLGKIPNIISEQQVPRGVKYVPATDSLPSYCQISGNFVTDAKSGATANFLGTLPLSWNGGYLQYGCFGHCGFFLFNDATHPQVNLVAQGMPGDSLRRGYASFATDGGHESQHRTAWAVTASGEPNREVVDDFLYRSTQQLSKVAKPFVAAFYSDLSGEKEAVSYAYLTGCSGGGRDALVAAAQFPEEFDGIIAGSPNANLITANLHWTAMEMAHKSLGGALTPVLLDKLNAVVLTQCDGVDGLLDGLIQNPAACDFDPDRDLLPCRGSENTEECFTPEQLHTVSTALTAVTDEHGQIIQPALSVSDLRIPEPDTRHPPEDTLRVFGFDNDPTFNPARLIQLGDSGLGEIDSYRATVLRQDAAAGMAAVNSGIGSFPDSADRLIRHDRKLLIWHNLSDHQLTPYLSFNLYSQLAKRHGGYQQLQKNIRLFSLPGSGHCGVGGEGPASFDALSAMENWVENGSAPNALVAAHYPDLEFEQPPSRTMPLCKFPEMARYRGTGDILDADNWYCPPGDKSMLRVGASGRRAGVFGDLSPVLAAPASEP